VELVGSLANFRKVLLIVDRLIIREIIRNEGEEKKLKLGRAELILVYLVAKEITSSWGGNSISIQIGTLHCSNYDK
jgi:hypothetical protein